MDMAIFPPQTQHQIIMLSRVFNNQRRMMILEYIFKCKMATQEVLVRVLKLHAGSVSKDMRILLASELLYRERLGKRWVYQPNNRAIDELSKWVQ